MSNTAYLKQGTFEVRHSNDKQSFAVLQDNYGSEYIGLDLYCDTFYDDDIELLDFIMDVCQTEEGRNSGKDILDNIEENKCGMFINGEFYEWEQIKESFKNYRLDF